LRNFANQQDMLQLPYSKLCAKCAKKNY